MFEPNHYVKNLLYIFCDCNNLPYFSTSLHIQFEPKFSQYGVAHWLSSLEMIKNCITFITILTPDHFQQTYAFQFNMLLLLICIFFHILCSVVCKYITYGNTQYSVLYLFYMSHSFYTQEQSVKPTGLKLFFRFG